MLVDGEGVGGQGQAQDENGGIAEMHGKCMTSRREEVWSLKMRNLKTQASYRRMNMRHNSEEPVGDAVQ
jgi:hypothetical protein